MDHDVLAHHPAASEARSHRRLDLHRHRFDPRALELHPALQPRHRGPVDRNLGAVGERSVRRALRARRDVHLRPLPAGTGSAMAGPPLWDSRTVMLTVKGLCTDYLGERGQAIRAANDVTFEVPQGKLFTLL